jgi:hypothetical protein
MGDLERETAQIAGQEAVEGEGAPQPEGAVAQAGAPAGEPDAATAVAGDGGESGRAEEIDQLIELVRRAYPDIVAELLAADSTEALLASIPAAREAFARVAASLAAEQPSPIPTGAGRRPPHDVETLSPEMKIRLGVGNRLSVIGYRG